MSDIFLSYASADRPRVEVLIRALERRGWCVWWDRTILPGQRFPQVIQETLDAARCVIVVWSQHSVNSDWVQNEAREGARRRILVPVRLDEVRIPLEFQHIQAARLLDWHDTGPHPEFDKVVQAVEATLETGAAPSIRPSPNSASPGDDKPFGAVPRSEGTAMPSVSAKDRPEVHHPTTSDTREITGLSYRQKRRLLLVGGVLLCVLVTALYLVLSGRIPGPQSQDATITTPRPPTQESKCAQFGE